jgi:solute carrier family 25 phosphate transporter 23/24/25/41
MANQPSSAGADSKKSVKRMRLDTLLAGGIAGAAARTITAPLDRVKILMQTQRLSGNGAADKYTSLWQALFRVAREDGIKGYWRGNLANCIRVVPYSATQFVTFEHLKSISFANFLPTIMQRLTYGALAGMAASFVTHPLDVIRLRLAVEPELRGVMHAFFSLWKEGQVTYLACPFLSTTAV